MRKLLVLISCFCVFISAAQINSTEIAGLLKGGDLSFNEGDYMEAIRYYKEVMVTNPSNMKAQYQLGESYRLIQDYESAEYYYEMIGSEQDIRYPLAGYYHALMQKLKGRYEVAMRNFRDFRKFMVANELHEAEKYRYYYKQARVEMDGCQLALNQMTMFHPDHAFAAVARPVNSEFNDWAAFSIGSDDILCLTSGRSSKGSSLDSQFGEAFADLFRFKKNGDSWEEYNPKDKFESAVNTKFGDGSGSFNKERNKFYYTNCDEDLDGICHIYVTKLDGSKWSEPVPLNTNINEYDFSSKHPNLTPGGDTLFFASDREGGMGQLDLYMSLNAGNDNWGPPMHLGPEINTPFNEVSPMYDNNEQVLFFASNGHRGFGGFDIYIARGAKFENAEIYNAGIPFNSYSDDIFFFLGDRKGFLSSNREEGPGKFDIYEFKMKSRQEIISELSGEGTIAGRNSLFTDDYNFDSGETEIINQIISRRLSSSVTDIELILSERQLAVYNSLSDDDKDRIDRIVSARFKKMTDNMIQSIRTEDDYYYQQLSVDKRRKVDNMVASYLDQQGLGNSVSLSEDLFGFYSSVGNDEREKIDLLISDKLKSAQSYKAATPTYSAFSDKEKQSLDGIALKYIKEKKNLDGITLSMNEKVFLRDNQGKLDGEVSEAVRERIIGLSAEEKYRLVKDDRDFYESLPEEDKLRLRSIAETFMVSDLSNFSDNVSSSDLEVFKGKSSQDQNKLDKLLLKQISNLANSSIYLTETTFSQEELQASLGESSDETIEKLLELRPDLTDAQKSAVKRFVKTAYDSYMAEAEPVFQREVPVVTATAKLVGDPSARLSAADVNQYNDLPDGKKRAIDNIIGLDYLVSEYSERTTRLQDEYRLSEITNKEKVHIAVLAKKVSGQEIKPGEQGFLRDAFTYYNNLSQDRKAFINRVVLDRGLPTKNGRYVLPPADAAARGQLTTSEQDLVATLKKFRFNNDRILTENLALDAKDVTEAPVDIIALAAKSKVEEEKTKVLMKTEDIMASEEMDEIKISLPIDKIEGYGEITIRGKLVGSTSGDALSSFAITLIQFDNTSTVIEGYTDESGFFEFVVDPARYDLTFKKANSAESVNLEEFNVEGKREKDASVVVNATRAFFDVSSSKLRPEVRILLDEVWDAYKSSGKKIEIESHTDDTGTSDFNLVLSKDRGYAARDYLIAKGVDKSKISVIWHGSENPIADNSNPFGRQLNRRIDVRLLGKRKVSFGNFYLIRPGTTVSRLSASMSVNEEDIRRTNGLGASELASYQPIRLKQANSVEPDYNLLVPADIKSGSDLVYTVKQGDNLQTVAKKFNVPEELIMEQNGLTSTRLEPGTRLIIYPKN